MFRFSRSLWLVVLGVGLYAAWQFMGMSPTLFQYPGSAVIESIGTSDYGALSLYAALLVAMAIFFGRVESSRAREVVSIASGILVFLGLLLSVVQFAVVGADGVCGYCGKILSTFSVVFVGLWGASLCQFDMRETLVCLAFSHLLAFLIALLSTLLPAYAQVVVYVLLPLAWSAISWLVEHEGYESFEIEAAPSSQRGFIPWRLFIGLASFGIFIMFTTFFSEEKTPDPDELNALVAGVTMSAVVAVLSVVAPRNLPLSLISRIALPLVIVCFFVIFMFDTVQPHVEVFIIGCTWVYFRIYCRLMWRVAAGRSRLSAISVFSIGQAVYTLFSILGIWLFDLVAQYEIPHFQTMAVICVLAILISTFLLGDRYIATLESSKIHALDFSDESLCRFCVDKAAQSWKLTDREQDICLLLIKGEDIASTRQELVIAQSTMSVHLRNIYRKADVHSKQELLYKLRALAETLG